MTKTELWFQTFWFVVMLLILVLLFGGCTLEQASQNYNPQPSFIWAEPLMWSPGQIIIQR